MQSTNDQSRGKAPKGPGCKTPHSPKCLTEILASIRLPIGQIFSAVFEEEDSHLPHIRSVNNVPFGFKPA